jgi:hypothetical protein
MQGAGGWGREARSLIPLADRSRSEIFRGLLVRCVGDGLMTCKEAMIRWAYGMKDKKDRGGKPFTER